LVEGGSAAAKVKNCRSADAFAVDAIREKNKTREKGKGLFWAGVWEKKGKSFPVLEGR